MALPGPPVALVSPTVLGLDDGSVLVLAGQSPTSQDASGQNIRLATVEALANGRWSLAAAQPEALSESAIVVLLNGDVLVVGGVDAHQQTVPRAYLYQPGSDRWSRLPDLPAPRAALFAAPLKDGTVLVGGGASDSPDSFPSPSGQSNAWIFDPATRSWRSVSSMHGGRLFASATQLPDGRVLVAGGDGQGNPLASAEVFDPATISWTAIPELPQARSQQVAIVMGGNVVLMGGRAFNRFGGGFALNPVLDAEIFDVGSKSWSLGSPPNSNVGPEPFAAVAPAGHNRLLVLTQPLQGAVAYDVGADYWSRVTSPPLWQTTPVLATMANGKVLMVAGRSAWRFDPVGDPRSGDSGFGRETVVLALIAALLLLLIGLQRVFRGQQ